jgi:hypothetical protein
MNKEKRSRKFFLPLGANNCWQKKKNRKKKRSSIFILIQTQQVRKEKEN